MGVLVSGFASSVQFVAMMMLLAVFNRLTAVGRNSTWVGRWVRKRNEERSNISLWLKDLLLFEASTTISSFL